MTKLPINAPPRWNLHTKDGKYFTTVRADDPKAALAQAKKDNPNMELYLATGRKLTIPELVGTAN